MRRVNTNIDRLWAWRSNDVRISGQSMPVHLGGQIAVERPRNFRLTAGILGMDEEADFGSNTDWFWFWVKRGSAHGQPSYVYQARHEDVRQLPDALANPVSARLADGGAGRGSDRRTACDAASGTERASVSI